MRFIVFYVYGSGTLAMALNNFFMLMFKRQMFRFINSTNTEKPSTVQDFDDVSVKEYLDYNVQIALRNL